MLWHGGVTLKEGWFEAKMRSCVQAIRIKQVLIGEDGGCTLVPTNPKGTPMHFDRAWTAWANPQGTRRGGVLVLSTGETRWYSHEEFDITFDFGENAGL